MKPCIQCGLDVVDPDAPPQYDILNPDTDLDEPENAGPYCTDCFPTTITGAIMDERSAENVEASGTME